MAKDEMLSPPTQGNGPLATVVALFWKLFTAFSRQPVTWISAESENPFDHHHTIIPDICHGRHGYTRVNFFGRCKFLQISRKKLAFLTDFTRKSGVFLQI